jgi:hypothetical protein
MGPLPSRRAPIFSALSFILLVPSLAPAQEEVIPYLWGEVRIGDDPFPGATVVLHRVSADASGEIDSVRAEPDGNFRVRLPHVPDHASRAEIFFASVQFRGLHYFGPAVTEAYQLDSLYLIQAYDTASVPPGGAQLPIGERSIFLERSAEGWTATDLFQLRLEGEKTLFSRQDGIVWAYPLAESATDFELGQGDMAPDAVRFSEGRLELYSPLPPGERYVMVRYRIPDLELVLPLPGQTDRFEVLLREPAPSAEFHPLSLIETVELEPGNTFRRYAAENLVNTQVRGSLAPEPWSLPAEGFALLMAFVLGAAGVVGYRRRQRSPVEPRPEAADPTRDQIILAVAALDEAFEGIQEPSPEARGEYERERKALLQRLKRHT